MHFALAALRIRDSAITQALEGVSRWSDNDAILDEFRSQSFRLEDAFAP